jgi:hypothetical protein
MFTIAIGIIAASLLVVLACAALSRERKRERTRKVIDRLQEAGTVVEVGTVSSFADFSRFDDERLLKNRSERWD